MCLELVTKTFSPPLPEEREAWKIVERKHGDNRSYPLCYGLNGRRADKSPLPEGVWLQAVDIMEKERRCGYCGESFFDLFGYEVGFHAYTTREAAEEQLPHWLIVESKEVRRVVLRGITAEGNEYTPVIVAKEMFIPRENYSQ